MLRFLVVFLLGLFPGAAAQDVPFVVDAMTYARTGKVSPTSETAVYATVTMTQGVTSAAQPNRAIVQYAHGRLRLSGPVGNERLSGELEVWSNLASRPTEFLQTNRQTLTLSLGRKGDVTLLSRIDGVALMGRPATQAQMTALGNLLYFVGPFNGQQVITLALSKSVWPPQGSATPSPAPAVPKGMRVKVSGFIDITNADDGPFDDAVEMFGGVTYTWTVGGVPKKVAVAAFTKESRTAESTVRLSDVIMEIYFNDPRTWLLKVNGVLSDEDTATDNEGMFAASVDIEVKSLIEKSGGAPVRYGIPGDRDSESADVIVIFEKIGDLY